MHFVQVEGDLSAFEEREKLMQKVAQDAVDRGDISFWAFLKFVSIFFIKSSLLTPELIANLNIFPSLKSSFLLSS